MKKLLITYRMTNEIETTENCIELPMQDDIAKAILAKGSDSDYVKPTLYGDVYRLLQSLAYIQVYEFTEFCSAETVNEN